MRLFTRRIPSKRFVSTASTSSLPISSATTNVAPPQASHSTVLSTPPFYMNKVLDTYATKKATPVTLRQLLFYERHRTKERLIKSANYVRQELPIRIAHRIREFQNLPFIVGMNPHIQQVYRLYWEAFERLRVIPPIKSLEDNQKFCKALHASLDAHRVVIPQLSLGMQECQIHMDIDKRDKFISSALRSRISRRVIAEQHLILSDYSPVITKLPPSSSNNNDKKHHHNSNENIMIFQHCSAHETMQKCIQRLKPFYPTINVIVDDTPDVDFAYVGDHIEYILHQLLLNSMQYTTKKMDSSSSNKKIGDIRVTICSNERDLFFRVSDQANGIEPSVYQRLWSFGHPGLINNINHSNQNNLNHMTTWTATISEQQQELPQQQPLGMGLPMSKIYATYWGGDLKIITMEGYGSDAYVRIPKLGDQLENLDVEDHASDAHVELDSGSDITHRRPFVI
ncbi:unnamed protein product [Cunninghamella blakesleeana]